MAGHLLLVALMYSFSEKKAQALLPPKLTVNPAVITETETVTLNCQTPSSVSVSQCYFHIERGKPGKVFSCLKTLTGTELLEMTHQSSPAEVKVTCFYLYGSSSPDSDVSSIIIRTSLPPKLTVNSVVINDTDSVTLNCQPPSTVSVSQCHFYTVNGGTAKVLSCLQTLTATELLEMAHQSLPAKIQVTCFYTVKIGELNYPSPYSDRSSITIHSLTLPAAGTLTPADTTLMKPASGDETDIMERESRMPPTMPTFSMSTGQKPEITFQHFYGDRVFFTCSLPGSANRDTRCNLYLGEATRPVLTTNTERKKTSTNQRFCQFTVIINDLLRRLHLGQQSDASCDYSLGSEPNSLSPRSDRYKLTEIVERESYMTPTMPTFSMTTGLTVNNPGASTPVTLVKTTSSQTIGTPSDTGASISTFLTSVKPEAVTGITSSAAGSLTSADTTSINPTCGDEITAWY
uniref:uncharacterized protein LOC117256946 n=1 Tax=Epinephelus lanceolatus TaxID=310571 RepID=UPI00144585E1|nr:uncharacterized protein LOC117256946 [Epinephelus lanceolatus]